MALLRIAERDWQFCLRSRLLQLAFGMTACPERIHQRHSTPRGVSTRPPWTRWLWLGTVALLVSCHKESAESKNSPSRIQPARVESHLGQEKSESADSFEAGLERTDEAGVLALLDQQFATAEFDSKTKYYFYRLARPNPALALKKLEEGIASDRKSFFKIMAPNVILELCKNHAADDHLDEIRSRRRQWLAFQSTDRPGPRGRGEGHHQRHPGHRPGNGGAVAEDAAGGEVIGLSQQPPPGCIMSWRC